MVFVSTLVAVGLVATAANAAPTRRSRFADRRAARRSARAGGLAQKVPGSPEGKAEDSQSTNWSGAVLEGTNWQTVSATITMPTPKEPSGGDDGTTYSASAWVGIDGYNCQSALWQTGVDFNVQGGQVSYDAWWEWIPDAANFFDASQIGFSAGDTVLMEITATSTTTGSAKITNQNTGQSVSKDDYTGPAALCLTDAEWIVEDFSENGGLVPLANWGSVTFSNATATTADGTSSGPSGAEVVDLIDSNGNVLTSTSVDGSSVTDTYTGN